MLDECTANNGRINSRGYYPRPDTMARLSGGRSRYPLNLRCAPNSVLVPPPVLSYGSGAVTALTGSAAPTAPKENTLSTHHSPYGWGAQDLNAARMSRQAPAPRKVPLRRGLLIEDINGWVGEVVKAERIRRCPVLRTRGCEGSREEFPVGSGLPD